MNKASDIMSYATEGMGEEKLREIMRWTQRWDVKEDDPVWLIILAACSSFESVKKLEDISNKTEELKGLPSVIHRETLKAVQEAGQALAAQGEDIAREITKSVSEIVQGQATRAMISAVEDVSSRMDAARDGISNALLNTRTELANEMNHLRHEAVATASRDLHAMIERTVDYMWRRTLIKTLWLVLGAAATGLIAGAWLASSGPDWVHHLFER